MTHSQPPSLFDPSQPDTATGRLDHPNPPEATLHPYSLGASLYMPATRSDIWHVINRAKLKHVNSLIICLEDAISERDVTMAMIQLQSLLSHWAQHLTTHHLMTTGDSDLTDRPLVFVRPRHPKMLQQLSDFDHIGLLDGFVLPKMDMTSLPRWQQACENIASSSLLMPTLETAAIFDPSHNQALALTLKDAFEQRIFALRIGGNDLFAALRLRRPNHSIIYHTPIGTLISQLLGSFVPHGYYLSAPVFEYLNQPQLLNQELTQDVALGLVGKTVIHPSQISLVHDAFRVAPAIFSEAEAILATDAQAVFKFNDAMLEPATHHAWATEILHRAAVFGLANDDPCTPNK